MKRFIKIALACLLLCSMLPSCREKEIVNEDPIKEYDFEEEVETAEGGIFRVCGKDYVLDGAKVVILKVTNLSDRAYNFKALSSYFDKDGKRTANSFDEFSGMAPGFTGYLILRPGVTFEDVKLRYFSEDFERETTADLIKAGNNVDFVAHAYWKDFNDFFEQTDDSDSILSYWFYLDFRSVRKEIGYLSTIAIFDGNGELFGVYDKGGTVTSTHSQLAFHVEYPDIPWDDTYQVPDNLMGDITAVWSFYYTYPVDKSE